MRRRHCGFVPVVAYRTNRHVVGVATDVGDLVLRLTRVDFPAGRVPVGQCMTKNISLSTLSLNWKKRRDSWKPREFTATHGIEKWEIGWYSLA